MGVMGLGQVASDIEPPAPHPHEQVGAALPPQARRTAAQADRLADLRALAEVQHPFVLILLLLPASVLLVVAEWQEVFAAVSTTGIQTIT